MDQNGAASDGPNMDQKAFGSNMEKQSTNPIWTESDGPNMEQQSTDPMAILGIFGTQWFRRAKIAHGAFHQIILVRRSELNTDTRATGRLSDVARYGLCARESYGIKDPYLFCDMYTCGPHIHKENCT